MANQYRNALQEAAQEVQPWLDRYGITVDGHERMVVWRDQVEGVPPGTTKAECLRLLRSLIAKAKQRQIDQNQAKLL